MRIAIIIALLILLFGCTQKPAPQIPEGIQSFTDDYFSLEYPESWSDIESDNSPDFEILKGNATCHLAIRKTPLTPSFLMPEVEKHAGDAEVSGDRIDFSYEHDYIFEGGSVRFNSYNRFIYCGCDTYWVTVNCLEQSDAAAEPILSSASCSHSVEMPAPRMAAPGIVPTLMGGEFVEDYCHNVRQAREGGAEIIHRYYGWGDMEPSRGTYNWTVSDFVYEISTAQGMPISAVVQVVYTNQLGSMPSDIQFTSFSDTRLKERFATFMNAFLDRYPEIEYVEIGNEVDIYLSIYPEQVADYKEFYSYVYDEIKKEHPGVKVSTIFAYHAAKVSNSTWIIEELADVGDFNAFTLYVHQDRYHFNGSASDVRPYLDEIDDISGDRPFALTEIGWSSASTLGSDEQKQSDYVEEVFSIMEEKKGRVEFFAWYMSHDLPDGPCRMVAEGFITEDIDFLLDDREYMTDFEDFICTQGLRTADDEPKQAWHTWVGEIEKFD